MGKHHSSKTPMQRCVDCGSPTPPAALSRYGRCPDCRIDRLLRAAAGRNEPPIRITPEDREGAIGVLVAEAGG